MPLMAVAKHSISLDENIARRVETAAESEGQSFSAWLAAAAELRLTIHDGLAGVAEFEAECGTPTAEQLAAGEADVDRALAWAHGGPAATRGKAA
jgi:hypothetical protein